MLLFSILSSAAGWAELRAKGSRTRRVRAALAESGSGVGSSERGAAQVSIKTQTHTHTHVRRMLRQKERHDSNYAALRLHGEPRS